jgi:hypothetical protein
MRPTESDGLEERLAARAVSNLPSEFRTRVLQEVHRAFVQTPVRPESMMAYLLPLAAAALVAANLIWSQFLASGPVSPDYPFSHQFESPFAATSGLAPGASEFEMRRLEALLRLQSRRPAHVPLLSTTIWRASRNEESIKWTSP